MPAAITPAAILSAPAYKVGDTPEGYARQAVDRAARLAAITADAAVRTGCTEAEAAEIARHICSSRTARHAVSAAFHEAAPIRFKLSEYVKLVAAAEAAPAQAEAA